jgi:hypothetical protein
MRPEPDVQTRIAVEAPASSASEAGRRSQLIAAGILALATLPPAPLAGLVERLLVLCQRAQVCAAPPNDGERSSLICAGAYALMVLPLERLELLGLEV